MTAETLALPRKKRELRSHHFDSTIWNHFNFRADDIIIATYGKSGTTWMQQIISQLIFNGVPDVDVSNMSPWLDLRIPEAHIKLDALESQTHRRFVKTHLPVDALVFSEKAKYIYIGRDGRDVVWSLYNHHANGNELFYKLINETPGRVGPKLEKPTPDIAQYFRDWMDKDGYPFWPFWEHIRSWWSIRHLPNVMLVHFAQLKENMPREIEKIANFLEIDIDENKWNDILKHCSFDYMKKNGAKTVPLGGAAWDGGSETFINKGTNGRWKDILTKEDNERYEQMAVEQLGEQVARWLATGQ
ncbi:sulfotransferase domain-containing protein [Ilyomonas limi]|uniref:Sulfotransferase domain-containing protein n=1 Tax=Ilyomonas limi TaxID=2575867 RepID=A0A4U3KYB2_9BACT|nr:sulfotransferase domain-containing protein [Ilyomonas limi]TKK67480.1 sulfotransferase domain-containing protein [Ilyomonas limi]